MRRKPCMSEDFEDIQDLKQRAQEMAEVETIRTMNLDGSITYLGGFTGKEQATFREGFRRGYLKVIEDMNIKEITSVRPDEAENRQLRKELKYRNKMMWIAFWGWVITAMILLLIETGGIK